MLIHGCCSVKFFMRRSFFTPTKALFEAHVTEYVNLIKGFGFDMITIQGSLRVEFEI